MHYQQAKRCWAQHLLGSVLAPQRSGSDRPLLDPQAWSIREVARRMGRDVKAVHGDVHALIDAGLLDKTAQNQIRFPFDDAIRVDFTLRAA